MPSTSILSGVQDLPKIFFAAGSSFRMTINMDADFPLAGKFAEFGIRCTTESATGSTRRIFRTDSDESNLSISSQIVSIVIDPADETVPAFTGGWTLADVQDFGDTEYWIDFSDDEGDAALLRLQGRAKWVKAGEDLEDGEAVISAPEFDVTITSGAVAVTVAVTGGEVGIPVGGSTGQVLKKTSATAYDVEWATVSGTGDVVGPASSTDNAITRFDGTIGKALQNSGITIADGASGTLAGSNSGDVTLAGSLDYITISGQTITRNAIDLEADVTGTLSAANGGTGQTSLGAVNAADLGSGAATDNYVLTADGLGGSAWEAPSGGGDALVANSLDQFADVTQTAGQTLAITSSTTLSGGTHSGTNTGDNAVNSLYSGLVTNATHTGDVTGATALTIADDAVTNTKAANMAVNTIKGRVTAGTGDPEDLTASQVRSIINVEDAADVTDTANVTAAGALMDSEVTNLAQVKAFSSADYATAAQGGLADSAIQPGDDAADLGSSAATDGYVLTADGAGGAAWEVASGGGGSGTVTSIAVSGSDGIDVDSGSPVTSSGTIALGINASTLSAHLGLGTAATTDATAYAPALGADDNYVTDAEKTVIGNTSGTNTGDNAVNSLYSGLVTNATHTGDVTGDNALTIANGVVTEAKCNSSINASLDLADSSIQPGNAALTDERVPTASGLTSKFGTSKATIVDGDKIAILDSAATDAPKHSLFSLIKSTLKTYFDTLYAAALGADDNYVTDAEKAALHAAATVTGNGISLTGQQISLDIGTGSTQVAAGDHGHSLTGVLGITIDGAGTAITTGVKGYLLIPYTCTITAAELTADQSGSIVIDVWKDAAANFPPTDADSITASAPPTLSSAQRSSDSTLTGWTVSLAAGDYLGFNVDSASTVTRVTLALKVTRTI